MEAFFVIMRDVLTQDVTQRPLAKQDHFRQPLLE